MVYSQNEIRHSKENEGTTTSRNSIDEFQKVARYKIVHVIFIYIHPHKVQKHVRLIYGEVKAMIILEQVSGGKSRWEGFGEWGKGSIS